MKKGLVSFLAGAALLASPVAFAAPAPLAPGGAAGVKAAESMGGVPVYAWVGGVLVVVGLVAVLSDTGNGHTATTTCGGPATGGGCGGSSSATTTR